MSPYYAACAPAPESKHFNWEGLWSAGLFGRTEPLKQIFDVTLPFLIQGRVGNNTGCGEDAEICLRSFLMGWNTYYLDELRFQHYIAASRLTNAYSASLLNSVNAASEIKSIYQRALQIQHLQPLSRKLFFIRQYIKLCWPLRHAIKKSNRIITKDLLFFLRGNFNFGRTETIAVQKFIDQLRYKKNEMSLFPNSVNP
jgi:hypothetical protein